MRVVSWRKLSAEELILSNYGAGSRSDSKESACNSGDLGLIPGLGRSPGRGHDNLIQYSCLENPNGWRCLEGYSPWGYKESEMTEWLSTAQTWTVCVQVTWTARRSNQSILKEYSLEWLKLKLQCFGHLMRRADSLEKILLLGKVKDRRKRWQRMRWLESITDSVDMNLSKLWKVVEDRGVWCAVVHTVTKSWTLLSNWTTKTTVIDLQYYISFRYTT